MYKLEHLNKPILYLQHRSVVDDIALLKRMKSLCFTDDVRACWVGSGLPFTNEKFFEDHANWSIQHWAMYAGFFCNFKDDGEIKTVLDVGCGCGHATVCLGSIFPNWNIAGIDMDHACLSLATEFNMADNVIYKNLDFFKLETDEQCDYIFALEILEHLIEDNHYAFIDKCLSLLKPNGLLFFTTPNENQNNKGKTHGHIGILNHTLAPLFYRRYKDIIIYEGFYDNTQLLTYDIDKFTTQLPFEDFKLGANKSHFKFIFKKI